MFAKCKRLNLVIKKNASFNSFREKLATRKSKILRMKVMWEGKIAWKKERKKEAEEREKENNEIERK